MTARTQYHAKKTAHNAKVRNAKYPKQRNELYDFLDTSKLLVVNIQTSTTKDTIQSKDKTKRKRARGTCS